MHSINEAPILNVLQYFNNKGSKTLCHSIITIQKKPESNWFPYFSVPLLFVFLSYLQKRKWYDMFIVRHVGLLVSEDGEWLPGPPPPPPHQRKKFLHQADVSL
jgi:hypothetical protein